MQFLQSVHIDYISKRKKAYFISISLLIIGIVSYIVRGGPNYGIDFKGGTSILIEFEKTITTQDIRDALIPAGYGNSEIKSFGTQNQYIIYIGQQKELSASEMVGQIQQAISASITDVPYEILETDSVGPKIGQELRKAMVMAILIALLLMLIYIGWRFEFVFAVGAVIALFHDVLITLGIFILLNYELSLKEIAAFLTIVGYSMNDTIIVYDRIRENLKIYRSDDLNVILNRSINTTMSRTVITSLTTFVVVLSLFIFGSEVIKGFAFVMLVGIIIGTYSSIFVASPVVFEWQMRHGGRQKLKMAKKKR
ncbi:protein translocase subunit SecF [bacterium]|nr:protein translocase subunit SecF [bacterium]